MATAVLTPPRKLADPELTVERKRELSEGLARQQTKYLRTHPKGEWEGRPCGQTFGELGIDRSDDYIPRGQRSQDLLRLRESHPCDMLTPAERLRHTPEAQPLSRIVRVAYNAERQRPEIEALMAVRGDWSDPDESLSEEIWNSPEPLLEPEVYEQVYEAEVYERVYEEDPCTPEYGSGFIISEQVGEPRLKPDIEFVAKLLRATTEPVSTSYLEPQDRRLFEAALDVLAGILVEQCPRLFGRAPLEPNEQLAKDGLCMRLVNMYLRDEVKAVEIAEIVGVDERTVRRWYSEAEGKTGEQSYRFEPVPMTGAPLAKVENDHLSKRQHRERREWHELPGCEDPRWSPWRDGALPNALPWSPS